VVNLEKAQQVWERALGELQIEVSKANYATWLKNSRGISCEGDVFVVGVPNTFVAEWLSRRFHSLIKKTLAKIMGEHVEVEFAVCTQQQPPPTSLRQVDGGTSTKVRSARFNPQYTFDDFVVGDCNRLAYAAAIEVSERPCCNFNPVFIYGDTGTGKTHLLQAIGHAAIDNGTQVAYVNAEQFTNEFLLALKDKRVEDFREKFTKVRMLLFDDIQFISDKRRTQEYFSHIFDELHNNRCRIVITANCSPEAMPSISHELRSRLQWGLIIPIQPPDFETCLAILHSKNKHMIAPIPEEALRTVAHRIQGNTRQLEGALTYVSAVTQLSGTTATAQTVTQFLEHGTGKEDKTKITEAVARYFQLAPEALASKKRDKRTSLARQIAVYLMRKEGSYSFAEIGKELGNRDHSTVLHAYSKLTSEMNISPQLREQVSDIERNLHSC
jgi:chromosomal replication initiator protein